MMFKNRNIAFAAFVAVLGCAQPPEDRSSTVPDGIPALSPPSDPDAVITVTVVGSDGAGGRKIVSRQTITKREQWLSMQAALQRRQRAGEVDVVQSAAAVETCSHGSQIVLWDQKDFQGNILCLREDGDFSPLDLADFGMQPRSWYTLVPACIYSSSEDIRDEWYRYDYHQKRDLQGQSGRFNEYIVTPGDDRLCPTIF